MTLGLLHITYIVNSSSPNFNCLLNAIDNYQLTTQVNESYRNSSSPFNLYAIKLTNDPRNQKSILTNFMNTFSRQTAEKCSDQTCDNVDPMNFLSFNEYLSVKSFAIDPNSIFLKSPDYHYLFAFERGVLMLSQEFSLTNISYQFNVLEIEIDRNSRCFGPKITNRLVDLTKSLDVIIMNWAIHAFDGKGFLYNMVTKELLNLNYAKQYVAKKGIQLHEMGRRESYHKSHSNNYLNIYLKAVQSTFSPVLGKSRVLSWLLAFCYDWLDGLMEIIIGSVRSTTFFQFFVVNRFQELSTQDSSHDLTMKILNLLQQYVLFRVGVVFSTTFLFFLCTSLVAYILRQTQEKMVRFTFLLQYHVTHNQPIEGLIFTHVTESLVFVPIMMGIYFFLFEFFSDQLVSPFLFLLFIFLGSSDCSALSWPSWCCWWSGSRRSSPSSGRHAPLASPSLLICLYSSSLRSRTSIKFFPRIFLCYFYLFHIYFFAYPFGFSYLALFILTIFDFHAMMHFWNLYEVPAFDSGMISPAYPRIGRRIPPAPEPAADQQAQGPAAPSEDENPDGLPHPLSNASSQDLPSVPLCEIPRSTLPTQSPGRAEAQARAAAGPTQQQRSTTRFVIQLPSLDLLSRSSSLPLPPGPVNKRRSNTDVDSMPPPSLEHPLSSARDSLSSKSTSAEASPSSNRPRSGSNLSTGSAGGSANWKTAVFESAEVRRMRLEQEKIRFQVSSTPSFYQQHHAAPPPSLTRPSGGSSTSSSLQTSPARDSAKLDKSPPPSFPPVGPREEGEGGREVVGKDELIGFFLDDDSPRPTRPRPKPTTTTTTVHWDSSSKEQQDQRKPPPAPAAMPKNYSFNVFGDGLMDD